MVHGHPVRETLQAPLKVNLIYVYFYVLLLVVGVGYVTVSAKVPRRLKEMLDKYGVKPGPVIRTALEEEVRKRVLEELEREARGALREFAKISDEEIAELIREDRRAR